jgi:hypothetical protein
MKGYAPMIKVNKPYSRFPKYMAHTEISAPRLVERVSTSFEGERIRLTDKEKKHMRRGQFAFGSVFPYVFDGLANAATYYPNLFEKTDKNYYVIELPIDDLCHLSLMGHERYNREHFVNELLKQGNPSDKEEAKHLRYIPLAKGDYLSIQPLIIGFRRKTQEEIPYQEIKRLMNLKTYSEHTQVIKTVFIYVLKALINPLFKGYAGGWFSCPNALQAKIIHTLKTLTPREKVREKFHNTSYCDLRPLTLRKHFLYLNTQDGSQNTNYIDVDAIDLWEHVSPTEIKVDGTYKYIRNWTRARDKLEAANRFFGVMEARGLMEGAKAFPTVCPKGIYYHKDEQTYRVYYKRSPGKVLKKK